jgi:hypothetical protein
LTVEVANAANQVKAQSEAFSAVSISVGNNLEAFNEPDDVFVQYALS